MKQTINSKENVRVLDKIAVTTTIDEESKSCSEQQRLMTPICYAHVREIKS